MRLSFNSSQSWSKLDAFYNWFVLAFNKKKKKNKKIKKIIYYCHYSHHCAYCHYCHICQKCNFYNVPAVCWYFMTAIATFSILCLHGWCLFQYFMSSGLLQLWVFFLSSRLLQLWGFVVYLVAATTNKYTFSKIFF